MRQERARREEQERGVDRMPDHRVGAALDDGLCRTHRHNAGPARSERVTRADVQDETAGGEGEPRAREPRWRCETSRPALDQCQAGDGRRHEQDQERRVRPPSTHERGAERTASPALAPSGLEVDDGERRPRRYEQDVDQPRAHRRCRP